MSIRRMGAGLLCVALLQTGCGDGAPTGPTSTGRSVGPAGGTLSLADGAVTLVVPPDAVSETVTVSVEPAKAPPSSHRLLTNTAYRFEPHGLPFLRPVQLTIRYDPGELPDGILEPELRLNRVQAGRWREVPGSAVDADTRSVSGAVDRLAVHGVLGAAVARVTLSEERVWLGVDRTTRFQASALDADGRTLPEREIEWSSGDPGIAGVDASGTVTGRVAGDVTITATATSGQSASALVTVGAYSWTVDSLPRAMLRGVWGTSASDVFAVGDSGTILHYDGASWTLMPSADTTAPALYSVAGNSSANVYAVGSRMLRYDGTEWTRDGTVGSTYGFFGVWVASNGQVFAVGQPLLIVRGSGSLWSVDEHPLSDKQGSLMRVWGTDANNVYAAGRVDVDREQGVFQGVVLHWDGSGWTTVYLEDQPQALEGLWGTSDGATVYAGGRRYDGSYRRMVIAGPGSWTPTEFETHQGVHAITGTGPDDVLVAGVRALHRFDGSTWESISVPTVDANTYYMGAWTAPTGELFLVGSASATVGSPGMIAIADRASSP